MTARKPDAEEIRTFLRELAEEDWLRRNERRWWPNFLFHYTDLQNAVSILKDGYLYSRTIAEDKGKLRVSSGSPSVLAWTDKYIRTCARLYFRPKTPTQFHTEGIQSQQTLAKSPFPGAHCPVIVFFLFDAEDVLTRESCEFSDGNLGSPQANRYSTAAELRELPWKKIYHQGSFDRSRYEEADIVLRRNAEVIVPDGLSLDALRYIYCRSDAEKETLLHLLPEQVRKTYQSKIVSTTRSVLFYRRNTFLEAVRLSAQSARFTFSPETRSPGPFVLTVEVYPDHDAAKKLERNPYEIDIRSPLVVTFPTPFYKYEIHLKLDDYLAYANRYEDVEVPF